MIQDGKPDLDWKGRDWQVLKAWLEAELQLTYRAMSKLNATNEETNQQKGRAAYITRLLSLDNVPGYNVPASTE